MMVVVTPDMEYKASEDYKEMEILKLEKAIKHQKDLNTHFNNINELTTCKSWLVWFHKLNSLIPTHFKENLVIDFEQLNDALYLVVPQTRTENVLLNRLKAYCNDHGLLQLLPDLAPHIENYLITIGEF